MKFPMVDIILNDKILVTYITPNFGHYITVILGDNGKRMGPISYEYVTPNLGVGAGEQAARAHISFKVYCQEANEIHPTLSLPR